MHFLNCAAACLLLASVMATPLSRPSADHALSASSLSLHRRNDPPMSLNPAEVPPPKTGNAVVDSQAFYDWMLGSRKPDPIWERYSADRAYRETGVRVAKRVKQEMTDEWRAQRKALRKDYWDALTKARQYLKDEAAKKAQVAEEAAGQDGQAVPPGTGQADPGVQGQEEGKREAQGQEDGKREAPVQPSTAGVHPMIMNVGSRLSSFPSQVQNLRNHNWKSMVSSNPLPYLAAITQQRVPAALQGVRAPRMIPV